MLKKRENEMSLPITEEMEVCIAKYTPYFNEKHELLDDAPEEAKRHWKTLEDYPESRKNLH